MVPILCKSYKPIQRKKNAHYFFNSQVVTSKNNLSFTEKSHYWKQIEFLANKIRLLSSIWIFGLIRSKFRFFLKILIFLSKWLFLAKCWFLVKVLIFGWNSDLSPKYIFGQNCDCWPNCDFWLKLCFLPKNVIFGENY